MIVPLFLNASVLIFTSKPRTSFVVNRFGLTKLTPSPTTTPQFPYLIFTVLPSKLSQTNTTARHLRQITNMDRVPIWHIVEQRKISGMAAPKRENLELYLQHHPNTEVYINQDARLKEIRRARQSAVRKVRAARMREFNRIEKAEQRLLSAEALKKIATRPDVNSDSETDSNIPSTIARMRAAIANAKKEDDEDGEVYRPVNLS